MTNLLSSIPTIWLLFIGFGVLVLWPIVLLIKNEILQWIFLILIFLIALTFIPTSVYNFTKEISQIYTNAEKAKQKEFNRIKSIIIERYNTSEEGTIVRDVNLTDDKKTLIYNVITPENTLEVYIDYETNELLFIK